MTTTATTTSPETEQLMLLVADALTFTDDQKNEVLGQILEGKLPAAFEGDGFKSFCDREQAAAASEVLSVNEEIAALESLRDSEEQTVAEEAIELVDEQRRGTTGDVSEFNQDCSKTERDLGKKIEGDVRTGEASQADAIRSMLKQKPEGK